MWVFNIHFFHPRFHDRVGYLLKFRKIMFAVCPRFMEPIQHHIKTDTHEQKERRLCLYLIWFHFLGRGIFLLHVRFALNKSLLISHDVEVEMNGKAGKFRKWRKVLMCTAFPPPLDSLENSILSRAPRMSWFRPTRRSTFAFASDFCVHVRIVHHDNKSRCWQFKF